MNRAEFENRVEKRKGFAMSVTEADWKIIEKVYTFHPSISETKGKEQIADLYTEYGMGIIRDMESHSSSRPLSTPSSKG